MVIIIIIHVVVFFERAPVGCGTFCKILFSILVRGFDVLHPSSCAQRPGID